MRHIGVTNKKDQMILIHVEDLMEAFPAADNKHSVCVIRIPDGAKDNSFLVVKESTQDIFEKLKGLKYDTFHKSGG